MTRLILTPPLCLALVIASLIGLTYAREWTNRHCRRWKCYSEQGMHDELMREYDEASKHIIWPKR